VLAVASDGDEEWVAGLGAAQVVPRTVDLSTVGPVDALLDAVPIGPAAAAPVRRGGTAVIIGVGGPAQPVEFSAYELSYTDKTLRGTWFGSGDPRIEFPRVLHLWKTGRLDLEGMITHRGRLQDINAALDGVRAGGVIRTVLSV